MAKISFHRINGYRQGYDINEIVTYAKELGVDYIEFDVRRTSDGVMVVWHDVKLPSGRPIAETTQAEYVREAGGNGV